METDQAVERLVATRLRERYPTFAFVGEETFQAGMTKITDQPTFIVDPIDGTTNFVHGFPAACISLGLAVTRIPSVGVVYNPTLDLLYAGAKGGGAWMERGASLPAGSAGKKRTTLSSAETRRQPIGLLSTALVAIEWGSTRDGPNYDLKTDVFRKLAMSKEQGGAMVHSLRSMGSAALNICSVAAGEMDLYWEGGCWAWDVCAGWCILVEAGGIMAGGNPGVWEPKLDERVYLAVRGAPSGQRELVEEFWKVVGDKKLEYEH
jgi:myo-inositol-1(or 4)-monophosphatase